jgi:rod shape-determining protein MreC
MLKLLSDLWTRYREYVVLVFLLSVALYLISISDNAEAKNFRTLVFGAYATATSTLTDPISVGDLRDENARLREANARLTLQAHRLREYAVDNVELRRMLDVRDEYDYELQAARVVSKSLSVSHLTFSIDRGAADGVQVGMPVVTHEGLVGVVFTVTEEHATVRTLKHVGNKLVVKDERNRNHGVMSWDGERLVVTNLPKTADVEIGDRVVSSEKSTLVGITLPVGVVKDVVNLERGVFKELVVEPYAEFESAEHVFVIERVESEKAKDYELNFFAD